LPRLLRAYKRYVAGSFAARRLKIVGSYGWGGEYIDGLVSELGLADEVELLGKVDEMALRELYLGAHALLMPSLYEGFGLPVVEALSVGVPVITSRNSAMAEVAGGSGLYVDPYSEDEILQALVTICEDHGLYSLLVQRSTAEARRYSWESSAATMADLLFR
jgi:glycosyltransferase involved in cell wall biosynthesis